MQSKILIVEGHPLFADALALCIRGAMSEMVIVHASTVTEAKAAIYREKGFDLVLLDLWLPDTHGFDGLIELRKLFPRVPIVVISAFADQSVTRNAIVCGAVGFIPKSASKCVLLQAIADVLAGNVALPPAYFSGESVGNIELTALTCRLESLTQKQLRVLQMLCHGLLNKQIAYKLDIHPTTVKSHVTEILRKLGVASRTQAVLEVSKLNLGAALALYAGEGACSSPIAAHRTEKTLPESEASDSSMPHTQLDRPRVLALFGPPRLLRTSSADQVKADFVREVGDVSS
jgi:DNA-binding NarL/FixJ family response regulator